MDTENNIQTNDQAISLDSLKQKALSALTNIMSQIDNSNPQLKFDTAMAALKYGPNINLANIALDAALATEDAQTKSDMLMQILAEINFIEDSIKQ
jgi:hypothetical protein